MIRVVSACLLLVVIGQLALTNPTGPAPRNPWEDTWVRTVAGWERPSQWQVPLAVRPIPALHPAVVAAGMLLASGLALAGLPAKAER